MLLIEISTIARQQGVNVIGMVGGDFLETSPQSIIFNLVHPETFSGLIISGTLGRTVSPALAQHFCDRFAPLPIVSGAFPSTGITQVFADSTGGMRSAVEHLVVAHNCRRIAFIRGPARQKEAEERFQAYLDILRQYALPVAPELIVNGDYWRSTGRAAMQDLLDRRISLDAVVSANDDMAIGALEVLQMRGVRVPEDIAVVGFDDMLEASLLPVPLTTVRQSIARSAQTMMDVLLRRIDGEQFPAEVTFPTELIIRQSCGCVPSNQAQQRTMVYEQVQHQQKMTSLQYFNRDIVAVLALEELGPVLEQHFPILDIRRGYISLYEHDTTPPRAKLILAYTEGKAEKLGVCPSFPLHDLAPAEMLPQQQGYTMIAIPFLLRDKQLGFGLFEMGLDAQVGEIYDRLGEQFSGMLFRVLLLQQLEAANQALRQNIEGLEASVRFVQPAAKMVNWVQKHNF
jgi:DNA-binding LacI/PurR family transcriptional regulator